MRISDWSLDVCSSDLAGGNQPREDAQDDESCAEEDKLVADFHMVFSTAESGVGTLSAITTAAVVQHRGAMERRGWPCGSEQRRVGKECVRPGGSRWWRYHEKKKQIKKTSKKEA